MNAETIKVKFYHGTGKNQQPSTTAILCVDKKKYIGTVTLFASDTYDKSSARRHALEKALTFAKLPKADRTLVWAYYNKDKYP